MWVRGSVEKILKQKFDDLIREVKVESFLSLTHQMDFIIMI